MFKFLTALTALVCISLAFPQTPKPIASSSKDGPASVISNATTDDGAGNFAFSFETSNGIKGEAKGNLKKIKTENGTEDFGEVQQGSYSYVGDDGNTYALKWIADENGFQPQADFLPTTPKPIASDPKIDVRTSN